MQFGDPQLLGPVEQVLAVSSVEVHFIAEPQQKRLRRLSSRWWSNFDMAPASEQAIGIRLAMLGETDPPQQSAGRASRRGRASHGVPAGTGSRRNYCVRRLSLKNERLTAFERLRTIFSNRPRKCSCSRLDFRQ